MLTSCDDRLPHKPSPVASGDYQTGLEAMPLVSRLLLLIALAMTPVFAAQLYTQVELQRERDAAARSDATRYARLVSSDAERLLEGAKSILIAVGQVPFIRKLNEPECASYLAALTKRYPQIFNITVIDEDGKPVCANTPIPPSATAKDRFYFQEAMRSNDFVVGDYIVGRTIPQPQLPLALPLSDDAGHRFVLSLGLGFDWLQQHFSQLALPPDSTLWIADRDGTILVAPSDAKLIGRHLPAWLMALNTRHEGAFERTDQNGEQHIVGFEPSVVPPVGLIVAVDLTRHEAASADATDSRIDLSVLLLAILATAAVTGFGATYLVSRPLRVLTEAARKWAGGAYDVRTGLRDRGSEVGQLAVAFDRMAEAVQANQRALQQANETLEQRVAERTAALSDANQRLETEMAERQAAETALRQAQKMEAVGQLTGGIAHDFNNLLTAIGGSIDFLIKAVPATDQRAQRYGALGRDAVQRAARLTHRLLAFARQQPLEVQRVDLNRLVAGMSELLARTLGEGIEIETVLAGGLWATRTDPVQVENALLNLAINARDAMPLGGKLTIETANAWLDTSYAQTNAEVTPGQYVMLAVSDTGTGMSPDTAARAFDPFFTTKAVGKGTGLGLSMIYGFAKQSGGHAKIYSELGRGTTIKLYMPRVLATTDTVQQAVAQPPPSRPTGETVLVVEDDDAVRELSVGFLGDLGYSVLAAPDAATALDMLRQHRDITVLFTDVVLAGGMDGRELAEQATALRQNLRVLFTTGYTSNAIIHGGILDPGVHLLTKPFTAEALDEKLRRILETA